MCACCLQGTLAQAVKKGEWILLDEINLAAPETLECLSGLLEGTAGSLVLLDRGDTGESAHILRTGGVLPPQQTEAGRHLEHILSTVKVIYYNICLIQLFALNYGLQL